MECGAVPFVAALDSGAEAHGRRARQRHVRVLARRGRRLKQRRQLCGQIASDDPRRHRAAIEHGQQAVLVGGRNDRAAGTRRRERRRAVHVPIVIVVFDDLVVAEQSASGGIECDDRVRVEIVPAARFDIEVGRGVTGRQV